MNSFKSSTLMFLLGYSSLYATDLDVQITRQSDWNSGFCSNVTVFNPNDNREQWNISFNAEGLITNLWNANYSQSSTTLETTAYGVGWNDFVEPHSSITFGYCANKVVTAPPPPTPPSDGDLVVTQTANAQWDGGFCKNVQVKNTTDHEIDWEVVFPINGAVSTSWSSNFSQNSETLEATASGLDWNNIVHANSQVEFGYCANEIATPPNPDQVALDADKNSLTFETIKLDNSAENSIKTALTLPSNGAEGSTIAWNSDSSAISNTGVVNQPAIGEDNIIAHLTATLTKGSLSETKSFTLTVVALEMSDADIVANDIDNLTFNSIKSSNTLESEITSNLNLISSGKKGSQISWVSNQIGTVSTSGGVIRPAFGESDVSVTLTANLTKGSISENKTFNLIVLANEETIVPDSKYSEVLPLALKFYEAQRATGPFPTVSWRKAGGLNDGADVGRDLTGGWFDAGDHVKFNLPMSYSATMLNWGMLAFPNAYNKTGKLAYGKEQVKYALDYFIQAYNEGANPDSASDDKVYYQVGDGGADHGFWGPPELMTMERPTFTCDATNKCSEVAGGMAAAMASGAILFQDDAIYSATLLDKAKKIYRYAEEYQGNNGYTAANGYYRSYSGYSDELAWGAVWLYKATGDTDYLNKAKSYIASASDSKYWSQNWDNVSNGVNLLLTQITNETAYKNDIEENLNYWVDGIQKTTGGLAFLSEWGSLRYSSTASFMALLYAKGLDDGQQKTDYITFAKGQIDYILGDNPRNSSYVVGYGDNAPINPHHRASHNSQTNNISLPTNNEFVLEGALVGGPKSANDFDYVDDRGDYKANEVATDYNAGFTGALAGMIELTTPSTSTEGHFAVGYLPSWSIPWFSETTYANSQIATVNELYTHVVISFAQPDLTFNGTDWSGTGVQFSSDLTAVKKAIEVLQNRGVKVILAVGGATYNGWSSLATEQGQDISTTTHKKALKSLMDTLNLDGLDVDYEIGGVDSDNIEQYYKSILALKEVAGDKLLTVAGWSTGADCTAETINSAGCDGKVSYWGGNAGRERMVFDMLNTNNQNPNNIFDYVAVMSYDGGLNRFDPITLFKNYQEIYNGSIALGFEIATEGWGGAEIVATNTEAQGCESSSMILGDSYTTSSTKEPYSVERFVDFVNSVPNSGVMLWSLYKTKGATNCANALDFEGITTAIKAKLNTQNETPTTTNALFNEFNIGFGGSYSFPFSSTTAGEKIWVSSVDLVLDDNIENNSYYSDIKNFDASAFDNLQDNLKNSKFLVYWLVEGWEESWFNTSKIQQAMDAGYIPVFNYWWFGDKLMNGMPDATKKAEYTQDNAKVIEFLNKLNGTKLLIMEPEFNKENVLSSEANQHEFATIMGDAIDTIKADTTDVLFSLAMTDTGSRSVEKSYAKCGYENCALGDKYEWGRPEIIYNDLLSKLDFVSFQQMIGQFSRNPSNAGDWDNPNPIAYSDADIGIDELSTRIANFSEFLKEKYNKPVFLPYIAIATATWTDTNSNSAIESSEIDYSGWETKANTTYQELSSMKEELKNKGLFGFAPMALFDNPRHDYGGYQYFMNNEYHLGIIKSGAIDEVDSATNGDIEPKSGIIDTLFP